MVLELATFGLESGTQSIHITLEENKKTPQWTLVESSLKMPFSLHFSTKRRTSCVYRRCVTATTVSGAIVSCACENAFCSSVFFQGNTLSLLFWRRKMWNRGVLVWNTRINHCAQTVTGVSSLNNTRARKSPGNRPAPFRFISCSQSFPDTQRTHPLTQPPTHQGPCVNPGSRCP